MQELSGFPYFEVQFTKAGAVFDEGEVAALLDHLTQPAPAAQPVTDLLVMAHGWDNTIEDARLLYRLFFERVRDVLDSGQVAGLDARRFAVMGVLWPSKRFAEQDLIPSGAASIGSPIDDAALRAQLDDLGGVFDRPDADAALERAKQLVPHLEDSQDARREFADVIRSVLPRGAAGIEDASDHFFALPGDAIMERLSNPVPVPAAAAAGGGGGGAADLGDLADPPAGGAAGIGSFFAGVTSAAQNLLNYATYYQMKERAGTVGTQGVNGVLRTLRARRPDLKIHLIGHSFGGRLVTAAAAGPDDQDDQPAVKVDSMTLLQAAFSHNGFALRYDGSHDGFFRRVVTGEMVSGPVVITYTQNDRAVGVAYPLASLIAGQAAAALGDEHDLYGGIGRNGAQHTPEAVAGQLLAVGGAYEFGPRRLYNLNADPFITGHSDVCKNEVAQAVLSAVATT
jgi:pimeloyl-ACP methyl ester carboxylesterase